jgi:hypothetical protein
MNPAFLEWNNSARLCNAKTAIFHPRQKFRWQPREMTGQVGTGLTKSELVAELRARSGNEV